jgi:ubiquinone/menaquinone biosynthesis C-methylase UbiE
MHRDIVSRTAELVLAVDPAPARVLDVGCGTGLLVRMLAGRLPDAERLEGIDAAAGMIEVATSTADDPRLNYSTGVAEHLPFPDASFDLVVSTTSFDHWEDQQAGLAECARVLRPGGHLVCADIFSLWLAPTLLFGRRDRARTRRRATALVARAGLHEIGWHRLYHTIIAAVVATR